MTGDVMLLDPDLAYQRLAGSLAALGWEQVRAPVEPTLVSGEPEFATWQRAGDLLVYTCNPVVWLRVLDLSKVALVPRQELGASLQALDLAELPVLLRSASVERILLGILAVARLGAVEHLSAIRALMHHRDPQVAAAAAQATQKLTR